MWPFTVDHLEVLLSAILGVIALIHAWRHFHKHAT